MNMLNDAMQTDTANNHEVFYFDKQKAIKLSKTPKINAATAGRLNTFTKDGFIHRINDAGSIVKGVPKQQTETKQFKRFFGDSVITENKKPSNFLQVLMSTSQKRTALEATISPGIFIV